MSELSTVGEHASPARGVGRNVQTPDLKGDLLSGMLPIGRTPRKADGFVRLAARTAHLASSSSREKLKNACVRVCGVPGVTGGGPLRLRSSRVRLEGGGSFQRRSPGASIAASMADDGDNSAVRMLMDHLASVKLAAEETEWRLKTEIKALEAALKSMEETQQETEDQLDMAKNTIHELKTQMSKKWRLEALDDWKALVKYVLRCAPGPW